MWAISATSVLTVCHQDRALRQAYVTIITYVHATRETQLMPIKPRVWRPLENEKKLVKKLEIRGSILGIADAIPNISIFQIMCVC